MELKDVLKRLESSSEFNEWKKSNKDCFLAHAFVMLDDLNANIWQIGFFDAEKNLMTTFIVEPSAIKVIPDQEVLKSDVEIVPLDCDKLVVSVAVAMNLSTSLLRREYSAQKIVKSFFIIQQHNGLPVYNITFFTQAFKTINVKIDAVDGKILHHSLASVAEFS